MVIRNTGRVIAIVDDQEMVRFAIQGLLSSAGFQTQLFESAEELLNSGAQHTISCLISDIRMPGMSGLELQTALSDQGLRIPIIFITAHGDERLRLQAHRAGALAFFEKPFDDEAFLESVGAAFESSS
jgi:FixJ family two-component response regulator